MRLGQCCVVFGRFVFIVFVCLVSKAEMGSIGASGSLGRAAGADPLRPGPQRDGDPEPPERPA